MIYRPREARIANNGNSSLTIDGTINVLADSAFRFLLLDWSSKSRSINYNKWRTMNSSGQLMEQPLCWLCRVFLLDWFSERRSNDRWRIMVMLKLVSLYHQRTMGSNCARTIDVTHRTQAHNNRDPSRLQYLHLACDKYKVQGTPPRRYPKKKPISRKKDVSLMEFMYLVFIACQVELL